MNVAVVTVCRGRARHVARQAAAVARMSPEPDIYLAVSMDVDPARIPNATVLHRPIADGAALPLAAARNQAIGAAVGAGADLVICMDADCLPAPDLRAHVEAAAGARGDALLSWPVGRLGVLPDAVDAPRIGDFAAARQAAGLGGRPTPRPATLVTDAHVERFWSLAFAVTAATHARIGGFDETYTGYGGEDTDYAFRARAAGVELVWVGGAWAFHQHHPVSNPPVEHLDAIVANARRFRATWGTWPMQGWLEAFAADGLVEWTPEGSALQSADQGNVIQRSVRRQT